MDFTRKSRWVQDGYNTADPEHSTFSGVVLRESVNISLTYVSFNGLGFTESDINNSYLRDPSSETHYVICSAKFGLDKNWQNCPYLL